jgi:hypothetical protein
MNGGAMHRLSLVTACLLGLTAVPAHAQDDFSRLKVKPGDVVYVTEPSGIQISGTLIRMSPSVLSVDGYDVRPAPGLTIEKRGDRLRDGALKGLVFGALTTLLTVQRMPCDAQERPVWHCMAAAGAVWAGVGTLIDVRHQGRTLVYSGLGRSF